MTADRASTRSSSLNDSGTLSPSSEKLGRDIRPSTLTGFSFEPGVDIAAIIAASESGRTLAPKWNSPTMTATQATAAPVAPSATHTT